MTPEPRDTVFVSEDSAFRNASSVSPPAEDPVFTGPTAPPEDLTLDSAHSPEEEPGPMWKQEVASRLESYRARRGSRRPRYNATMSLDFDRAANRMIASALAHEEVEQEDAEICEPAHVTEARNEYFGSVAEPERSEEPEPARAANPVPITKVLEFPRLPTLFDMAPTGNELAEPVVDKPRILYVPEEVPTAQAPLADIQIQPAELPVLPDFEFPLLVANVGQRVFATMIDGLLVLGAAAIFMAIVLRDVPAPDNKAGYALVAVLPAIFWAIYEYLFLVHCGTTPGMQLAHLKLASFSREPIGRKLRRARALAWMLSTFPLGLGIVWAMFDEDTLCWHDRITRTYVTIPMPEYED